MATFKLITSTVLNSTTGQVTFSSLPDSSTYTDLFVIALVRDANTSTGFTNAYWQANGNTASNYNAQYSGYADGAGQATSSTSATFGNYLRTVLSSGSRFTVWNLYWFGYSDTTANVSKVRAMHQDMGSAANVQNQQGRWVGSSNYNSTSAVSSWTIFSGLNGFVSGSRFYLYGIKRA